MSVRHGNSDTSAWLDLAKTTPARKTSSSSLSSTLSRLTSRLTISQTIRWTPASRINHDTHEGRTEFYNQVCHKLLKTSRSVWR
ncbi:hypothetical protein KIN20_004673 [Parelaphostrongylus tenuis]|uniref:Uncharacterized protein n=1 Tax=Parelaphostrongylus tenuis TaxID=148309 RepID=A0AAD5M3G3_PARTN|nr:hypothetical protein KIN20_004673 [Parelaphostrongylus tenuis]